MSVGWKTLNTQKDSLTSDNLEEECLGDH